MSKHMPRWKLLAHDVGSRHRVCFDEIMARGRGSHRARAARHELCYRMREGLGLTWMQIARHFGFTHPTSVISYVQHYKAARGDTAAQAQIDARREKSAAFAKRKAAQAINTRSRQSEPAPETCRQISSAEIPQAEREERTPALA